MRKVTILLIRIFVAFIAIFAMGVKFCPSIFGFVLFRANNYTVFNEYKKPLDAYIFEKNQTSKNNDTFELIVYFSVGMKGQYLTIVPAHRLIGLADQPDKNIWVFPGAKVAYMFPDGSFFTPLDGPFFDLIPDYEFSGDTISFNTFGDLKKIGNRIVIQRHLPKGF